MPGRADVVQDLAQTPAFVVTQALGNAVRVAVGDEDDEAPGQGDLLGQAGAFGPDRVLRHLANDALTRAQQLLDPGVAGRTAETAAGRFDAVVGCGPFDLVIVEAEVAPVQDGVFRCPDVDEGGLHARKHVLDPTEVDVPVDLGRVVGRPRDVVLDERAPFEHGDLRRRRADVDDHEVAPERPAAAVGPSPARSTVGPSVTGPTVTGPTVTGPTVTGPTVPAPSRARPHGLTTGRSRCGRRDPRR